VLDEMILVGSWCLPFYRVYFSGTSYHPTIRTRDIDFLVPQPNRRAKRVDVAALLKEKGFVESFSNSGFIQFMHPELIVEFLVPEKGRGSDKPVAVPRLGINAQPLRFLDFLASHAITLKAEGLAVRMPHPAAYGLHKLIVATRRTSREKSLKDLREAIDLLNALIRNGEGAFIKSLYKSMLAGWRSKSKKALKEAGETRLLEMLEKE
jgi:hypothetical protein